MSGWGWDIMYVYVCVLEATRVPVRMHVLAIGFVGRASLRQSVLVDVTCCVCHFCTFAQVNDSADDRKTSIVMTGTDDIKNLCQFVQWDGNMTLSIWKGSATKLHGTEGLFFHPLLDKEENLYAFVDDVKRSFKLNHTEDVSILDMSAYRYRVDYKEFLSAKDYPPNADYGSYGPTGTVYLGPVQIPGVYEWGLHVCVCVCV